MGVVVHKYGGVSVGSIDKIKFIADKISSSHSKEDSVVAVVSAMEGETDRLIELAHKLSDDPDEREMDLLMSSGERISAALLAIRLNHIGCPAISFTGRQIGLVTDSFHMKARIKRITGEKLVLAINEGKVCVVAGFQGIDEKSGSVTTLGRGGSDTTAVAVAVALKAERCEIYKDVAGIMTTDPNIEPKARLIKTISFDEMLETSSLGAKVLQIRSVEFAKKYNMPIAVKPTFFEGSGSIVTNELESMENIVVSTVAYDKDQAKVTLKRLEDKPGIAGKIFEEISKFEINVDMIIQNVSSDGFTDISFTVPRKSLKKTVSALMPKLSEIGATEIVTDEKIGKVSIIGVGMRNHTGIAYKAFSSLADAGINIMMISTSEIKISCVVSIDEIDRAVRILHDRFQLQLPPEDRKI